MSKKDTLQNASNRIAETGTSTVAGAAAARMRAEMMSPTTQKAPAAPAENPAKAAAAKPAVTATPIARTPAAPSEFEKNLAAACKTCAAKIKNAARYIFVRIPTMFWNLVRGINIVGLGNCALLLSIIIMFSILIGRVWNAGPRAIATDNTPAAWNRTGPAPRPVTMDVPANVVVSARNDTLTVTLPLQKIVRTGVQSGNIAAPAARRIAQPRHQYYPARKNVSKQLVANVWISGDKIVDGAGTGGSSLKPGAKIRGNLFLQNHRKYTLPCGIYVDGDLYLRNIGLLRFCDDFTVTGNIYVSSNSSFGPIPRTARLGGRVIF
ncbi:MAG: hypothetical protein FWG39_01450 [Alphaproteobacteria bacterium]|nr:hypothetical protein [Alphaproteobacteria bacterium]